MGFVARKGVVSAEDVASWPHVVGCLSGSYPSTGFAQSTMVFIPLTDTVHEQVRIVRSPNAPRQVTLCSCDCKALTTATYFRLRQFSLKCTHPSQGCVTQHHATYNVFQSETAVVAHRACMTRRRSGILPQDFACKVLQQAELPPSLHTFPSCTNEEECHDGAFCWGIGTVRHCCFWSAVLERKPCEMSSVGSG